MTWIEKHKNDSTISPSISWAITLELSDELIGSAQLRMDEHRITARLSYWLGRPFWNQGIAIEALEKVVDYGFNKLHLHTIEAEHFRRNPASGRVLKKLRFKYKGSVEQIEGLQNRLEIMDQYTLSLTDFIKRNSKKR